MKTLKRVNIIYAVIIFICVILLNNIDIYAAGLHTVDNNYINDLIGDKATGLGGAYAAISDDPSGAYYNPAGLVFAVDNQISLSVNNYKYKYIQFDKVVMDEPYTQEIASFYPSFFGVVQSLGSFKIALTIININNEILDQDDFFTNNVFSYNINYNITDNTLLGGLSLAHFFFSDSLSIGFSGYMLKRRTEQIANQLIVSNTPTGDTYYIQNQYITEDIYGVMYNGGIQWMPLDILSVGLCVGTGTILSHDREIQNFLKKDEDGTEFTGGMFSSRSVSFTDDGMPLVIRTGVAVFPSKSLLISADLIAHIGDRYYQNYVEDTFNGALGVEYYITPSLPVRMGLFTNFANTPVVQEGYINQEMHVDMYGSSMSLSWQTKNSSISLSGFYQTGTGKAQVFRDEKAVQDVYMYTYSVSLTGSAKY